MTAQLSGGVAADSFLYSFTPVAIGRGGSPIASPAAAPPPLSSARRHRAQSVPGEPTHRGEELDDLHTDFHVSGSPRVSASANLTNASAAPSSASLFISGTALGSVAMAPKSPAIGFSRCGSADRHQHQHGPSSSLASLASLTTFAAAASAGGGGGGPGGSGSGPMPLIGGGERGLPPMRHSISGNPGMGLPKLDLPAIVFGGGGGGGGGPPDVPGSGRRSLSGGFCDAAAAAAFLDMPLPPTSSAAAFDGSAPPSPSRGSAPAVLAPLRVSGAFAAAAAAAGCAAGTEAAAAAAGGGWCGSGGGSFAAVGSRRYTPSAGGSTMEMGGPPFSPGPLLPCASESAGITPLTPGVPVVAVSKPCAPPRRSHSLSSRSPAGGQRLLGDESGGGAAAAAGDGAGGGLGGSAAVAVAAGGQLGPDADRERGGGGCGGSSTAVKAMYDINNELQRAGGALLALHAPACRPRSPPSPAAAAATAAVAATALAGASAAPTTPPSPSVLTAAQLAALKESAPELQWELRVAVRRIFQVLRQELVAAPAGRQLGVAVHECWATLDAYLEGTTELTCSLVEGALAAGGEQSAPSAAAAAAAPPSGQRQPVGGDGGDGVQEAQREAERLRTDNTELRRQLEECRARLARAEAEAADAQAAAAAAAAAVGATPGGARGVAGPGPGPGSGSGSGLGTSPRPPPTAAAPPLERCCSTSPRRGKHALVQSVRDDAASASDGGGGGGAAAASSSPSATESSAAAAAAMAGLGRGGDAAGGPRRFDRAAVLARGPSYGDEMVIEGDDSEESDVEVDNIDARRHMLTYHSASFAEWVRGARRR